MTLQLSTFSRHVFLLFVIFVILGPCIPSLWFFVESKDTQANLANQLAICLHKTFEENTGFKHLHKLYDSLSCVSQNNYGKRLLHNITEPAAARLNTSMTFLQDLSKKVQQLSSKFQRINVTKCCQNSTLPTEFSDRLRSSVDLSKGCSISESSQDSQDSFKLNSALESGFQENFNESSVVAWQYYGSINGEYLQYPANERYCDGSTSQFDPRFKSWYVETASPVKKNLVIIIDRSGSMSGPRMRLAKDAAITVLDTLSPHDNVGIVAFSSRIRTPSGCFGSTVATGIPANLDLLKEWLRKIYALGSTYYAQAFRHAFSMFQNVTSDQSSERSNIILFLTDGDPSDSEAGIYQAIEDGQTRMNNSVQINTYALGKGLSSRSLQRLRRIAYNNSGVFFEIRDQNGGVLKRIMGSYYTSIKTPLRPGPRLSLPDMDSRLGLIVTVSLPLIQNGSFTGVVAVDLPLERLFKEALQLSYASLTYAVLVDKEGRAILHPSLPGPTDVTSSRSFLPLSLFEPALPSDVILDITAGGSGQKSFEAGFPQPLGNEPADGTRILKTNATYIWSPVGAGIAYYIVCVVANEQSFITNFKSFRPTPRVVPSFYHRLDISWNATISHPRDICSWKNKLISLTSPTVKIAPDAYSDSDEYIYSTETLTDLHHIQQFFNDHNSRAKYKGLSEAIRAEVMITSELDDIWQRAEFLDPDSVQWRFVGTQKGVLRTYPGLRLQKTYSHKHQPWFMEAASSRDKLLVSLRTSTYTRDRVVGFSKAVHKTTNPVKISGFKHSFEYVSSCALPKTPLQLVNPVSMATSRCQGPQVDDERTGDMLAVMGMEMTESAFFKLIVDNVGLKNETGTDWYIVDSSGYIVFNFSSPTILQAHKKHLTAALPWLANELIGRERILKASWCNNYQQHTVEMFYELSDFSGASSNSTDPCRQFILNSVPGTSLFLLGIPSRSIHDCKDSSVALQESCSCGKSCKVCLGNLVSKCQCPCVCQMPYDKCHNSVTRLWTSTPCPVPAPPLFGTEKDKAVFQDALTNVPRCARDCLTTWNMTECEKTIGCFWCSLKANPSCSSECRTGQSLSMVVLFPCNNFLSLSTVQQVRVKFLFKQKLRQLVHSLTALSLEILNLGKEGIAFKVHETTASSDLDAIQGNIQRAVYQGKVILGPGAELPKVYIAKSPKEFTDLDICLTLDGTLPQASQSVAEMIASELQTILVRLLGKSLVSTIRHFNLNKTSVYFVLSNEGQGALYPLQPFKERLEKAVRLREIYFKVPVDTGETPLKKITAVDLSAISTFDFLCGRLSYTTTPSSETTATFTRQPLKTTSQVTPFVEYSSTTKTTTTTTTGMSSPASPTEMDRELNQGLTPVETAVVVTVSVLGASSLPCILFLFITRRRRPKSRRKGQISPDGEPEEDLPSEISQLSEIDADLNVIVNRAYFIPEETRTYRSPKEAWGRARELTIPKRVPQGAWF